MAATDAASEGAGDAYDSASRQYFNKRASANSNDAVCTVAINDLSAG